MKISQACYLAFPLNPGQTWQMLFQSKILGSLKHGVPRFMSNFNHGPRYNAVLRTFCFVLGISCLDFIESTFVLLNKSACLCYFLLIVPL